MKKYYYSDGEKQFGPVSLEELKEKDITRETLVWHQDLSVWVEAQSLEEFNDYFATKPPPLPKQEPPKPPPLPKDEKKNEPVYGYGSYRPPYEKSVVDTLKTYMIVIAIFLGIGMLFSRIGYYYSINESWDIDEAGAIVQLLSIPIIIVYVIYLMMFIYKKWKHLLSLEEGYIDDVTPGKAVGFMFIPFYNFYWIFVVFVRFSKRLNAVYHNKKGIYDRIPVGLSVALSITVVSSIILQYIPVLGDLLSLSIVVLLLVYLSSVINAFDELRN